MSLKLFSLLFCLAVAPLAVVGQQVGATAEVHPPLTWQKCTKAGSCTTVHGSVTMDHNWRWLHTKDQKNCMENNQWDKTACPDGDTCAKNCQLDGIDYKTYGITTNGAHIDIKKGARLYLMANESSYEMFKLAGQEFTFDVDMSKLPCGLNGALYLVSMEHDGGAHYPNNKAGAKYGTGYCDAQCPKDTFIQGKANPTSGNDQHGACCSEMDLWEANAFATVYTPHPCTSGAAIHYCAGSACPGSTCESGGCGFNSYAMGNHNFYGPGKTVDSHKVMTVVTQFISSDGTANGHLTEIRRFYVQGGKVIPNSHSTTSGFTGNSLTTAFCDKGSFSQHGGLKSMGDALHAGMVLTFSLWGDYNSGMEWLDGGNNGPCPTTPQVAATGVEMSFSNIKVGPINSTFHA